jgi:hypothetical protein
VVGDLVDGDDARVPQLGGRPRLAVEAFQRLGRADQPRVRHLEGDDPAELGVQRPPDRPAGPQADALQEAESARAGPGREEPGQPQGVEVGELGGVLVGAGRLAGAAAVLDVQRDQLGQEGGAVGGVDVFQTFLQRRAPAGPPGGLEGVARLVGRHDPVEVGKFVDAGP